MRSYTNNSKDNSLLRTWLFGPGADSAVHDAMSACGANVLILDLEDSTAPPLRAQARAVSTMLRRFLQP